jgi:chlorite dismutase
MSDTTPGSSHESRAAAAPGPHDVSLAPVEGWHCTHWFYRFDRSALAHMTAADRDAGGRAVRAILDPGRPGAPRRLQTSIVSGHKADFGLMILDPDPLVVDGVYQELAASALGPALVSSYSFVSLTEVSEYVPTVEQYGQRLVEEGEDPDGPAYRAKLKAYEAREGAMRSQRLEPELPPWPCTCFYPMNKKREVGENWFTLPFAERSRLMTEHGRSGMKFAGKVTQLITAAVGLDDWEWGVTLWARNPVFLKEIVYTMRFDEASARYALFGPFYQGYVTPPERLFEHLKV